MKESDSTIPDPSHQTVTSTPPVIAPFTNVSSTKPSSLVTPPPINTEATTITTSLPEITPFIALQLRVARLELIEKYYSVLLGPDPSLQEQLQMEGTPSLRLQNLTKAEEEAVAREVHATHARIVSESEPEPTQRRQYGIAFRDSFIVSKKECLLNRLRSLRYSNSYSLLNKRLRHNESS
ncbi:hypothetical protein Tco_0453290 [Tanacetum coccineum]